MQALAPRLNPSYAVVLSLLPSMIAPSASLGYTFGPLSALAALKLSLCAFLATASLVCLPSATAAPMLRRAAVLAAFAFVGGVFAADSVSPPAQPRGLPPELDALADCTPVSNASYKYEIFALGPLHVTRCVWVWAPFFLFALFVCSAHVSEER